MTDFDVRIARRWLETAATDLHDACQLLTELDAERGDADHGVNMDRGFQAIHDALLLSPPASAGECLTRAALALRQAMGGTSGPLWSAALRRMGRTFGPLDPVSQELLAAALADAARTIGELGGAVEGENTMLDALLPAARAFEASTLRGDPLVLAASEAAAAADEGAASTAGRAAIKGRASYLGQRGAQAADPGATSAAIIIRALSRAVA
jgi:dihydroxyacetone kinase-like protein